MTTVETIKQRKVAINRIIDVIVEELEEKDKDNLTSMYAIGVLEEAIHHIKQNALMQQCYLAKKEEVMFDAIENHYKKMLKKMPPIQQV